MTTPELVADTECHTGEGPLWHSDAQRLYWVDIPSGRLFSYNPCENQYRIEYEREGAIGGFTIQRDGRLLLFEEGGRVETWNPNTGDSQIVVESLEQERGSRFNDIIADPEGRVFCGTMPNGESPGRLYRLNTDGTFNVIEEGIKISNGLGFAPDLSSLYHVETQADTIYRYDYERTTGALSNRRVFVDTANEDGHPDGMTVDSMGCVWVAYWDGGNILRYRNDGELLDSVNLPAQKVSSLTFGGTEYTAVYVTTALTDNERSVEGEGAGALFRFDPGVRGLAEFRSNVSR